MISPPLSIAPLAPPPCPDSIRGYNLRAERERYAFKDARVGRKRLNRGDAKPTAAVPRALERRANSEWRSALFSPSPSSAVHELGYPATGVYFSTSGGHHLDPRAGIGQLFDAYHPHLVRLRRELQRLGLDSSFLTGPVVGSMDAEEICTPPDLAATYNGLAASRFPSSGGFKSALAASGSEAVGRGLRLLYAHAHRRLSAILDPQVHEQLIGQLELPAGDLGPESYPFAVLISGTVAPEAVALAPAAHWGPGGRPWPRLIPITFNGDPSDFVGRVDLRPLSEILDAPGGVRAVLAQRRIPRDLLAGFVAPGMDRESGNLARPQWLASVAAQVRRAGALVMAVENGTFARTGRAFSWEHTGVGPDVIAIAEPQLVGGTLARSDLEFSLPPDWAEPSRPVFDLTRINISYTQVDTFAHVHSPLFGGLSYAENETLKGQYLRLRLTSIAEANPDILSDIRGAGVVCSLRISDSARHRSHERGVAWGKRSSSGLDHVVLPADVLVREIDHLVDSLL